LYNLIDGRVLTEVSLCGRWLQMQRPCAQHWGLHGGMQADNCSDNGNGQHNQPMTAGVKCLGEHVCTRENPMTQRNYGCDGQIRLFFGNHTLVELNATGEAAFKGQLYQCQLVQAFVLKQVYELRRSTNAFGHLVPSTISASYVSRPKS
jgi:hypothetical protein